MAWRPWLISLLAALWALLIISSPASAAIERFVDSQGVVHIRNVGPGAARGPSAAGSREVPSVPPESLPEPAPLPPPAAGLALQPEAPASQPEAPSNLSDKKAIQIATESVQRPETAGSGGNRPVLQRVSYPLREPAAALFKRKEPRSQATPAPAPEGSIRRFRDGRGVIHITNKAPESDTASLLAAGNPDIPTNCNQSRVLAKTGPSPAWQPVAWTGSAGLPARLAALAPEALVPAPGAIRRYRDAKGVLHIENVSAPREKSAPEPVPKLARRLRQVRKKIEITGPDGSPVLAWKKASLPLGPSPPPSAVKEVSPPPGDLLAAGTIRRYRDANGVLHLESVEPPAPVRLPAPVFLARPRNLPGTGKFSISDPPPGSCAQGLSARAAPSVTAFRDQKGRLVVRNREPEARIARSPPPEKNLARLAPILQEASLLYGLPVSLIQALIKVESNFAVAAVSPKGAMGLMQLMPGTAVFLGVQDAFDPRENVLGGCRYLRLLLDSFGGSLPLALAAYNAGYGRVVSSGFKVPSIKETQEFVTQVLGRYFAAEKRHRSPWV